MNLKYPEDFINHIINGDSLEILKLIPNNSIDLIITSPPYNVGIEYDNYSDNLSKLKYIEFINFTLYEIERILVNGGRVAFVVGNASNKTRRENFQHFGCLFLNLYSNNNINPSGLICWNKNITGNSTAWGSWMSPSAPSIRSVWESIVIGRKAGKFEIKDKIDINREEFLNWTCDLWNIPPASTKKEIHPTPFPPEIPKRLIKIYSCQNNIILDPFVGSGTTCIVAKQLHRNYIGIDISNKYCKMAKSRLSQTTLNEINENK